MPPQLFKITRLPWLYIAVILLGAASFLISVINLQTRYSELDLRSINNELKYFGWLAVIISFMSVVLEYFIIQSGVAPRGASLL